MVSVEASKVNVLKKRLIFSIKKSVERDRFEFGKTIIRPPFKFEWWDRECGGRGEALQLIKTLPMPSGFCVIMRAPSKIDTM